MNRHIKKEYIQNLLDKHKNLRDKLYCRGYVLTDCNIDDRNISNKTKQILSIGKNSCSGSSGFQAGMAW